MPETGTIKFHADRGRGDVPRGRGAEGQRQVEFVVTGGGDFRDFEGAAVNESCKVLFAGERAETRAS